MAWDGPAGRLAMPMALLATLGALLATLWVSLRAGAPHRCARRQDRARLAPWWVRSARLAPSRAVSVHLAPSSALSVRLAPYSVLFSALGAFSWFVSIRSVDTFAPRAPIGVNHFLKSNSFLLF